jgi:hypothetical protein
MPDAVDCSQSHPPAQVLIQAGVKAVICKLNGPNAVTAQIVQEYRAAGLVLGFYYENQADDVKNGFAGGQLVAAEASGLLVPLIGANAATEQPIYFADDQNDNWTAAVGYFVGINRVLHWSLVGAYGDGNTIAGLGAAGLITYKWQSGSSSYQGSGTTVPGCHIQQLVGPSPAGTDPDQLLQPDVGQFPRP